MDRVSNNKVLLASSIAMVFEAYDFVIYAIFATILSKLFFTGSDFLTLIYAYMVFSTGYIARPLGGIVLGHIADKFGRKQVYAFSIFFMSLFTLLVGCLPTYQQIGTTATIILFCARIFQGFAFGGELPVSIAFVYEHFPKKHRLFGCSTVFNCGGIGVLLATFISFICINYLSEDQLYSWGWRVPFFFGSFIAIVGWFIRYKLTDTTMFLKSKTNNTVSKSPLKLLLKSYRVKFTGTFLICSGSLIIYTILCLLMPTILHTYFGYDMDTSYMLNIYFIVFYIIMSLIWPAIFRKFNFRVKGMYLMAAVTIGAGSILAFYLISFTSLFFAFLALTFFALTYSILAALLSYYLARSYSTQVRVSGIGLSFNFASMIAGSLTPIVVTSSLQYFDPLYSLPVAVAIGSFLIIFGLLVIEKKI